MKKINKVKRDNVIVSICGIVMVIILTSLLCKSLIMSVIEMRYQTDTYTNYQTKEEVIEASKIAINNKEFCTVLVELQDNIEYSDGENEYAGHTSTYTYKTNKDKSKVMYSYVDQNDITSSLLEFWSPSEEGYDIYIWSSELDSYVKTSNDVEPVTVNTWNALDNMDSFELEYTDGSWGEQEEPSYILTTYGKNDTYDVIGQYVYISKRTLLPLGVITIGADYNNENIEVGEDGSITINDTVNISESTHTHTDDCEHDETQQAEHDESIVKITYAWTSNDSIDLPETFKTEEEFYEEIELK